MYEENWAIFSNKYLANHNQFSSNLVCKIMYIKDIQNINLVQIGPAVTEIQVVEIGKLAVPVNNNLMQKHLWCNKV